MKHGRRLAFADPRRPFWLLVALAVSLLATVSTTVVGERTGEGLLGALERDIGALRLQVETITTAAGGADAKIVAAHTDLGDGGPAFHRDAALRVARAARRRAGDLQRLYAGRRDPRRAAAAEAVWLALHDLEGRLNALDHGPPRAALTPLVDRLEAGIAKLGERREPATDRFAKPTFADGRPTQPVVLRGGPAGPPAD